MSRLSSALWRRRPWVLSMDKMAAMAGRFVQRTSAALICNSCRRMCTARKYTPRRSLLYIPGNDEKKVTKATGLAADCVVLDCEDGVAFNRKVRRHKLGTFC